MHGHAYARYTALRPRVCHACDGAILGPFSKACHCLACGLVVHRACVMRVPKAPCGRYRGLRDPDGRRSLPREAQEAEVAAVAVAGEKAANGARASPSPCPGSSGARRASVDDDEEDRGPAAAASGEQHQQEGGAKGTSGAAQAQASGGEPTPAPSLAAAAELSERRSMTYDALAMVGRLVGTMVGSGASASSSAAAASEAASPVKDGGANGAEGGGSGSGGFGFATLRSGARAIAGAYAGYTVRLGNWIVMVERFAI